MIADAKQAPKAESKARIFISYSRKDIAFADRLEAALKARGFEVLIDRTEIYAFEDWWKRIEALIGRSDTVVFVLSPDAVASETALKEVAHAASLNKRFAPIICQRVEASTVPEPLRRLNFIFFDDAARFDGSADQLAEALQTDIAWIRRHTEFGEAARRWIEAGRATGLLLRSPVLDQAEAWLAYRPHGAPVPTAETEAFIAQGRNAARATQRIWRVVVASVFTLLVGIILGLVGWMNQAYIQDEWRWYTVTRPYMQVQVRPHVLTAAAEQTLKPKDTFRECTSEQGKDYCPDMVVVPAGSFMMGLGRPTTDKAQPHPVTITQSFAVSKYELTFDEWDTCVQYGDCAKDVSDSSWGRGQQPVINVTWDYAQHFVAWLSKMTGKPYRLLSEAEYEYATRAGTTTLYPWGDENNANCDGCGSQWDNKQTAPIGSFAANAFGLYDMEGNVFEWAQDCYNDSYNGAPTDGSAWTSGDCSHRIIRGGSWNYTPGYLRSAVRGWLPTSNRSALLGFRVGRALDAR